MRRRPLVIAMGLACLLVLARVPPVAAESPPVRVALYTHSGDKARAPRTLRKVLAPADGFRCRLISPEAIRQGELRDVDVLIMPGGSARRQADHLGEQGREAIRKFVRNGGGYVGICAGSYLATPNYSWSLGLLNARVVDRQHWARGNGQIVLQLSSAGGHALDSKRDRVSVYYGQGPLLAPGHYAGLPAYEELAKYATGIGKRRGAKPETMIGTTAIARSTFGNGRVICFSPHPEASRGPNQFIRAGVRWAAGNERKVMFSPAGLQGEQITPAGQWLDRKLDGMDVEHHWLPGIRVRWQDGEPTQPPRRAATHCSAFVASACDRLGVYILRPPAHSQTLLANAQQRWLLDRGRQEGWRQVPNWQEAQQLANRGLVVVASYRNPNPRRPGHVALVRPSTKSAAAVTKEGPDVIWAGRHNHGRGTLQEGFPRHPKDQILFFAHAAGTR